MPIDFNLLKTIAGNSYDINSVAFSRDSALLASGGGDGSVRIWDVSSYAERVSVSHGTWVNAVSFAPTGQALASGARDGSVKLWNVENGQLFGTIQAHPQHVSSVAFSSDGRRLASGGNDGHVRVVDLREKKIERDIPAHNGWVWRAVFSEASDRIATAGGDRKAIIWPLDTSGEPVVLDGHEDDVLFAAFSSDDHFLATCGKDGKLILWESATGRQLFAITAHEGAVNCVAFSHDGLYLATAGADHTIRIWEVESSKMIRELTGHQDYVAAAVFSRGGKHMASCGGDGTIKIWEVTDRSAYASDSDTPDPDLEIVHEDAPGSAAVFSSAYSAGREVASTELKNGIKISLLQSAQEKFTIATGETKRPIVLVGDNALRIFNSTGMLQLQYDIAANGVAYDRLEGTAAPWAGERDDLEASADPDLDSGARVSGTLDPGIVIERAGEVESHRYQSFERHGQTVARESLSGGHSFRLVRFDENTVYLLLDRNENPTVVFKGENLDVRDASGKPVFRLHMRTLEPVVSRRGSGEGADGEAEPEAEIPRDPLLVAGMAEMNEATSSPRLHRILSKAVWAKASDIHIPSGAQVQIRRHGRLETTGERSYPPSEVESMVMEVLTAAQREEFNRTNDLDFSYEIPNVGRFRGNVLRQHRGVDATFRIIGDAIPTPDELGLPPAVVALTQHHNGLVLITGPAGQGKSTTIASLVNRINHESPHHVITIEDPIEYVYPLARAVVNQREVGRHTKSFANALRASLREDPDVIVVGEMRDLETISLAITASETGHLVFGSVMTSSATQTIDRILDSFPSSQQAQIRTMLSESLRGVVSQQLVQRADGEGRLLACEVLIGTPAVANMIRERKTFQLSSTMQTARNIGMQRMDDALWDLVQAGKIGPESAQRYSQDPKNMETRLRPRAAAPEPGQPSARRT